MPLTHEQDQERGRRRRRSQDDTFRERERVRAAQRRRQVREHTVPQQQQHVPPPWWTRVKAELRRYHWRAPEWDRDCPRCHAPLLRGEYAGFCCNMGKHIIPPLPPLPRRMTAVANDHRNSRLLSEHSRSLNYLFNFTAIGVSGGFTHFKTRPASVSMTGRTYHRMLDATTPDHSIHWFLYDESQRYDRGVEYSVPSPWVTALRQDLQEVNPYVRCLRSFNAIPGQSRAALEIRDFTSTGEFAAIMHTANTINLEPRKIVIWRNSKQQPTFLPITSRHYEPLQYPVLFPHGTPGWGLPSETHPERDDNDIRNNLGHTLLQWVKGRILTEPRFLTFGRLASEYLCDMYSRIQELRLLYIRRNRLQRAHELDPDLPDDEPVSIDLPASFLGSRRWASEQTADGLALARKYGRASFFVTFTTNPDWPEITSRLLPGQCASDAPAITARAFKLRLQGFMKVLRAKFGNLKYLIKVVEFQKKGLPHAHLIFKVDPEIPIEFLDTLITCQLPTDNPTLKAKVKKFMTHHDDHLRREFSRCNRNGVCIYGYPHPITPETWIDEESGRVHYKRLTDEERWIAPHVPEFIDMFDCHIYWDVVFTVAVFMYLYKYLFKGPDSAHFRITQPNEQSDEAVDEIEEFVNGRYLCAPEAAWHILNFDITSKEPSVTCLPVHLPGNNTPQFSQGHRRSSSTASLLIRYFARPNAPQFDHLLYNEYYENYTFTRFVPGTIVHNEEFLEREIENSPRYIISRRARGVKIARLQSLSPTLGEVFYLRTLLAHRPARTFEDLRNVNGRIFQSFHQAAVDLGLFVNSEEGLYAVQEAVAALQTPAQLRFLFARIVLEGFPARPIWDAHARDISQDFIINLHSDERGLFAALHEIQRYIQQSSPMKTLTNYGLPLPQDNEHWSEVADELAHINPRRHLLSEEYERKFASMTNEQRNVYQTITGHFENHLDFHQAPVFLEGKPGRGKTFLIDTLSAQLRSEGSIVLIAASSALAASIYDRGRTAHKLFGIPVEENNENLQSYIHENTARAKLIREAKLIVWDELPMANKAAVECADNLCRSIKGNDVPFGGIPFIGLGDFRQVSPVVRGAGPAPSLLASIKSSYLWPTFRILSLEQPIRSAADPEFTAFVDSIGEDYEHPYTHIPLIDVFHSPSDAIQFLFPNDVLTDPARCLKRSFLSPLNHDVDNFNDEVLQLLPGQQSSFYSAEFIKENDEVTIDHPEASQDYLSLLTATGVPPHELQLKQGCVCSVMRNLSIEKGLVKNARVIIHRIHRRFIEVRVIDNRTGHLGDVHCIPRIRFEFKPYGATWTVQRVQFPLRLAYATTFHSCQGLTLDRAVLDLRTDVFAHGQLYTALSRVRSRNDIRILKRIPIHARQVEPYRNVVYKDLLLN